MASIVVSGDTSGAITISAPAVAGTNTITLPAQTATLATLTTPSFATTIGVGGTTASASGAGISFPATQSASSDVNTLDDYEEGTWTPSLKFGGGTTGLTYKNTRGVYVKVGSVVTVHGFFELTAKGSSTGNATVTLPFSPNTYGNPDEPGENGLANSYSGMTGISGTIGLIIGNIGAACYFSNGSATTTSVLDQSNFNNNSYITFSATYATTG